MAESKKKTTAKSSNRSNAGRKKTNTKGTRTQKATKTLSAEVKGIILIALGIFAVVSVYTNATGVVGGFCKSVLMGLFGGPAIIFPVFIIWTGVKLFMDRKKSGSGYKAWILLMLMIVTSVFWALVCGDTNWEYDGFGAGVAALYSYGVDGHAGGVIGGLLCIGIVKCIGSAGAMIVTVAAMLILLIVLTELSFEKMFKKLSLYIKENKTRVAEKLDEEIDMDVEAELEERRRVRKRTAKPHKMQIESETESDKPDRMPNSDYFDLYFAEADLEMLAKSEKPEKGEAHKPQRFTFTEDTEEERADFIGTEEEPENIEEGNVPFRIADVHTGVLTQLPDENGNIPSGDDDDFEPPSLVQMQEKVDPMTQAAIDEGMPLDRAVEAGKRIKHEEAQRAADSIGLMAKENIEATRIINYKLPSVSLLAKPNAKTKTQAEKRKELEDKANKLLETLASFKVDARILNITQGPTVTRFELQPGFGIKVSKITNLADDIALSLAAPGVRIEAPIPGKSAIGIEIPNETATAVPIREVIDTDKFRDFKSKTAFALGKDIGGNCVIADIAQFPHILIAGATGSGKSVCINSLITSILYKAKPNEVKMIMVDPKMVELGVYNGIPHLLIPVVTDPKHAAGALNWAVAEMKNRYQLLKDNKVRNIQGYNELMEEEGTPENKLPEIVIIIDELADLMMAAKNEVEDAINSLAALARAAGMYLVIATQRPSVDVITGVIKANVPSRISFAVSSQVDSRTILDAQGAEKLLGKGDMLYAPRGAIKPIRIQGNFLSDAEIENIISYIKKQYEAEYDESILEHIAREQENNNDDEAEEDSHMRGGERDELFAKAAELVIDSGQASVAMLQRRFKVGYQRAARIIDQMEEYRVIGPYEGTKPRQVLMTRNELNEMLMHNSD